MTINLFFHFLHFCHKHTSWKPALLSPLFSDNSSSQATYSINVESHQQDKKKKENQAPKGF